MLFPRRLFADAFTLIEMLVVIAIIVVLAGLLFPAISGMQERGKTTQDMSNLRQIGIATQTYLNDNDSVLFPAGSTSWSKLLQAKYLPSWKIFQSPFDKRSPSEDGTSSPISYGFNEKGFAVLTDKITNPTKFVLFAPAQTSGSTVAFGGTPAASTTVGATGASAPGGPATGGTHSNRKRINALFGDLHTENMAWDDFKGTSKVDWEPTPSPSPSP